LEYLHLKDAKDPSTEQEKLEEAFEKLDPEQVVAFKLKRPGIGADE
jgi:hypothetical protein